MCISILTFRLVIWGEFRGRSLGKILFLDLFPGENGYKILHYLSVTVYVFEATIYQYFISFDDKGIPKRQDVAFKWVLYSTMVRSNVHVSYALACLSTNEIPFSWLGIFLGRSLIVRYERTKRLLGFCVFYTFRLLLSQNYQWCITAQNNMRAINQRPHHCADLQHTTYALSDMHRSHAPELRFTSAFVSPSFLLPHKFLMSRSEAAPKKAGVGF